MGTYGSVGTCGAVTYGSVAHLWGAVPQGPPGEVIQPLPLQTPHKNKRSIDASQPLWGSAAEDVGRGPSSPTGTSRPTRVGLAELLLSVGRDVEALRRPTGTKENPARSCRDLRLSQPHISDGQRPTATHWDPLRPTATHRDQLGAIGTHRDP